MAIPSLILSKKPDAKKYFDEFAPYQGWFGFVFAIWGLWNIISCFIHISLLTQLPVAWIIAFMVSLSTAALGFILGYGLIQKYALSKNEKAAEKGEMVLKKLMPLQGVFGIIAIIFGILQIVVSIIW